MGDSPVVVGPYSSDSVEVGVTDGTATVVNQRGYISVGFDGANYRFVRLNASGQQIMVGAGTAGTPSGGVLSVQGVSGGQALPISAASLPLPTGAATEATLASIDGNVDVALSTRASEATLATLLTEAVFTARIPTLGQKAMAGSVPVVIASDQSAIPVTQSGTWTIEQGSPPWAIQTEVQLDYDTGAGTQNLSLVGLGLPGNGGAVAGGTLTAPIRIDPVGTTTQPVSDAGGSLTVDTPQLPGALVGGRLDVVVGASLPAGTNNIGDVDVLTVPAPLSTTGGGTEATALRVTIANDSTGLVSVDDNGASLTTDTPQLPGALVGGRLDTNVGAWMGATTPTVGQKAMVVSLPVVIASDQSPVDVAQSGTWTVQQGTPPWTVAGTDADGAAPTENPVLTAGQDGTNVQTIKTDTTGRQEVIGGAADGATVAGNPVRVGGWDGTNVRTLEQRNGHPAADDYGLVVREVERTVPTFYVVFDRITMSLNKYLATLFNTSSTRKVVVQRIWVLNWQAANVPAGPVFHELYRITARTVGTAVTPRAEDTNDVLSAGISADTNSSAVTTDHLIMRVPHSGEELGFGSDSHNLLGLPVHALRYERRRGQRGLTLRQNQGISMQSVDGDLDGTTSVIYEFTDEVI